MADSALRDYLDRALGSDEEALVCAAETGAAWRATPGALDWLKARMKAGRAERKASEARLRPASMERRFPAAPR